MRTLVFVLVAALAGCGDNIYATYAVDTKVASDTLAAGDPVGAKCSIVDADAIALAERPAANHGGPLTDDQLRSLWLHRAAAGLIARDPVGTLAQARAKTEQLLAGEPDGARWLRQWLDLIDRGPEAVMRAMTSIDPLARELRQNSPFVGLLPDDERRAILEAFRAARRSSAGAVR